MRTVDIIYRYAGAAPERRPPPDSNAAVLRLNDGNRDFAALLDHVKDTSGVIEQIIPVDSQDLGLGPSSAGTPNNVRSPPYSAVRMPVYQLSLFSMRGQMISLLSAWPGTAWAQRCSAA